ncbi:hypothetical protein FQN54_008936, partial [Arachnomyces sp. PD_36]
MSTLQQRLQSIEPPQIGASQADFNDFYDQIQVLLASSLDEQHQIFEIRPIISYSDGKNRTKWFEKDSSHRNLDFKTAMKAAVMKK